MNSWQKHFLKFLAIFNLDVWFVVKYFKWEFDYSPFDREPHFHLNHWVVRREDYTKRKYSCRSAWNSSSYIDMVNSLREWHNNPFHATITERQPFPARNFGPGTEHYEELLSNFSNAAKENRNTLSQALRRKMSFIVKG